MSKTFGVGLLIAGAASTELLAQEVERLDEQAFFDRVTVIGEIDFQSAPDSIDYPEQTHPDLGTFYAEAVYSGVRLYAPPHGNRPGFIEYSQIDSAHMRDYYASFYAGGNNFIIPGLGRNPVEHLGGEILNIEFSGPNFPDSFGARFGSIEGSTPCCVTQTFGFQFVGDEEVFRYTIGPNSPEDRSMGAGEFSGFQFPGRQIQFVYLAQVGHQATIDDLTWGGDPRPITVIFINGIHTSRRQANDAFVQLLDTALSDLDDYTLDDIGFRVFYNPSSPYDLWEVFNQIYPTAQLTLRLFFKLLRNPFSGEQMQRDALVESFAEVVHSDSVNSNVLQNLVSDIEAIVDDGRNVVIVSYSQGNLYLRDAYADLGRRHGAEYLARIGAVQIAPPTRDLLTEASYVLETHDGVIDPPIVGFVRDILEDNVTNSSGCWATFPSDNRYVCAHYFENYLASGSASRDAVVSALQSQIIRLR